MHVVLVPGSGVVGSLIEKVARSGLWGTFYARVLFVRALDAAGSQWQKAITVAESGNPVPAASYLGPWWMGVCDHRYH